jgi:hypothetical protein
MNDLQLICLFALEDMTLKELNKKYFDNGGIGYTRRVVAGKAEPVKPMMDVYLKRFGKKYLKKLADYRKVEESIRYGW